MPRGHEHDPLYSLSIRNMVFQCIKNAIIIQTLQSDLNDLFFPIAILSLEKVPRKARVEYTGMCSCPLGIPYHP